MAKVLSQLSSFLRVLNYSSHCLPGKLLKLEYWFRVLSVHYHGDVKMLYSQANPYFGEKKNTIC